MKPILSYFILGWGRETRLPYSQLYATSIIPGITEGTQAVCVITNTLLHKNLLSVNEYLYNVSNVKSLGDIFCCQTPKLIVAAFWKIQWLYKEHLPDLWARRSSFSTEVFTDWEMCPARGSSISVAESVEKSIRQSIYGAERKRNCPCTIQRCQKKLAIRSCVTQRGGGRL